MNHRSTILGIVLCVLLSVDIGIHIASMMMLHTSSEVTDQVQSDADVQSFVVIRDSDTEVIDLSNYPQWQVNESGQTYGPDVYDQRPDLIATAIEGGKTGYVLREDMRRTGEIPIYASDGKTVIASKQVGSR